MPALIKFTSDETAKIVSLYTDERLSSPKIANRFGCSDQVILRILKEQGVKIRSRRLLTDGEEEQVVKIYKAGAKVKGIIQTYHISNTTFWRTLARRGAQSNRPARYALNEYAFDIIDNEAAAYWLGFIYADGCVYKNRLSIVVAIRDMPHLSKIRTFLETDRPLRVDENEGFGKKTMQSTFYVNNDHLAERLKELGILRDRPHYRLATDSLPANLLHHFLRGYTDGDGSIGRNRPRVRLCGQKDFLQWVRATLHSLLGLDPHRPITFTDNIAYIGYYGYDNTREILEFLYKDATIYLKRKRELADQWM